MVTMRYASVFVLCASVLFSSAALAATEQNHLSLFCGATTANHEDHGKVHRETHATLGLEYERRLSLLDEHLGVELLGEWVLGAHTETILGGGLVLHPWAGLRVAGLPAVAIFHDHKALLLRGTVAYDFHIASASISPTVSADYVDHHVDYVYGVAFGVGI